MASSSNQDGGASSSNPSSSNPPPIPNIYEQIINSTYIRPEEVSNVPPLNVLPPEASIPEVNIPSTDSSVVNVDIRESVTNTSSTVPRTRVPDNEIIRSLGSLRVRSMLSRSKFKQFVLSGDVRSGLQIRMPSSDDRACVGYREELGMYLRCFDMGLRYPLSPFISSLLRDYNIAPGQLSPNAWARITCFFAMFKRIFPDVNPSSALFRYFYKITHNPRVGTKIKVSGGWFCFSPRKISGEFLWYMPDPPSSHSGWHGGFVFVEKDKGCTVTRRWCVDKPNDSVPTLSPGEKEQAKTLVGLEFEKDEEGRYITPSFDDLLSVANIVSFNMYPGYNPAVVPRVMYGGQAGREGSWDREVPLADDEDVVPSTSENVEPRQKRQRRAPESTSDVEGEVAAEAPQKGNDSPPPQTKRKHAVQGSKASRRAKPIYDAPKAGGDEGRFSSP